MIPFDTIIYTVFAWTVIAFAITLVAIPVLIFLLLPSGYLIDNIFFRIFSFIFYWICIKCTFIPLSIKGQENIPKEPSIIIANHQSSFDIPLIGYIMSAKPHIWLAWAQLLHWPLLKYVLPRIALLVDLSSPLRASKSLVAAIKLLQSKPWDLVIFPEGGRYTDGEIHSFFGGFAVLAKKTGRPVVPIKISGVQKVYPPDTYWVHYAPITIVIGKPLHVGPDESEQEFIQRVRDWYLS